MGLRFRKSISLGSGTKLNISKRGLGISAGGKGARVGVGTRGLYTSTGIPGSGLYSVNYLGGGGHRGGGGSKHASATEASPHPVTPVGYVASPWFALVCLLFIIGIFMTLFGSIMPALILMGICVVILIILKNSPAEKASKLLAQADKFFQQEKYDEGIALVQQARSLVPSNHALDYLIAMAYNNAERFLEAIEPLTRYLSKEPSQMMGWVLLGHCHLKAGNVDKAISILQAIPNDFEEINKVYLLLGTCFFAQEKYDLAVDVFKKAPLLKRNLDDDLKQIHYNLGVAYHKLNDSANALKHFKKVYAVDVNFAQAKEKIAELETKAAPPAA